MVPSTKAHVAVLAFPFTSHPYALFFLARKLAEWAPDVTFSFFCTPKTNGSLSSWPTLPNLRFFDVSDGLPEGHELKGGIAREEEQEFFLRATPGNYREALKRVDEKEKVSCVLGDAFIWFAGEMAEETGVPWVAFWNGVACSVLVHVCTDFIRQMIGTQPHGIGLQINNFLISFGEEWAPQTQGDLLKSSEVLRVPNGSPTWSPAIQCPRQVGLPFGTERLFLKEVLRRLDESLAFIPGCSQFQVRDLPEGIVVGPLDSPLFKSLHRMSQELPRATAILINNIQEMDPTPVLDHLGTIIKKCLPVGPLSLLAPTRPVSDSDPHSCLAWLESKAPASVAYVGFGTFFIPPPSELAALVEGLEASGAHFLWSLKDEHRESLPAGFLDRTRGRGLVVPWTPQTRVLGHVAVGAFISHCGCNSVLESIMGGVPMMCRPFFGDQRVNARVLSQMLGIAAEIKGGVLTREGVMDGLDLLLRREEGKKMREQVGSLKLIGKNAVSQTGSTTKNLKALLEIISGSA